MNDESFEQERRIERPTGEALVRARHWIAVERFEQAETELVALSDQDVNLLGRFLDPRFRVHPELQKLARRVLERNPAACRKIQVQRR